MEQNGSDAGLPARSASIMEDQEGQNLSGADRPAREVDEPSVRC